MPVLEFSDKGGKTMETCAICGKLRGKLFTKHNMCSHCLWDLAKKVLGERAFVMDSFRFEFIIDRMEIDEIISMI